MKKITIPCSEEILQSLKETPDEFSQEIRMAAAAKLYELEKLSSGRAAELAGISRVEFLKNMGTYGVSDFFLTEEELKEDIEHA